MVQTRRRIDPRRREIKTNYEGKQRWEMKEEGHRLTILMSPLPTLNSSQDQTTTSAHSDWPTPISQRPTFVLPPFHFLLLPIEKELNYTKGKRRENNASEEMGRREVNAKRKWEVESEVEEEEKWRKRIPILIRNTTGHSIALPLLLLLLMIWLRFSLSICCSDSDSDSDCGMIFIPFALDRPV